MNTLGMALLVLLGLYVVAATIFIILENRRPQTTLARLLAFIFVPLIGFLV